MEVQSPPTRLVHEKDGNPIRSVEPVSSRYEKIAVKKLDGCIEIKALERGTEEITDFRVELTDELYRGVAIEEDPQRRALDDDLEDVLHLLGYTTVDTETKQY